MKELVEELEDFGKILLEEILREGTTLKTLSTKEEIHQYLKELKEEIERDESTNR